MCSDRKRAVGGFTLVEILLVITLIALLIGILIPAVGAVRRQAKETSSRATLASIETGIAGYRAETRLGGGFPPSASDRTSSSNLTYEVESPYSRLPGTRIPAQFEISGGGLLLWALAGADLQGSPGFRAFGSSAEWSQYTGTDFNGSNINESDAYAVHPSGPRAGEAVHARSGPYVKIDGIPMSRYSESSGFFEIPAEKEATGASERNYPMFLDSFGYPILYYRADPAGVSIADYRPQATRRGLYHAADNGPLVGDARSRNEPELVLQTYGKLDNGSYHRMKIQNAGGIQPGGQQNLMPGMFEYYLKNLNVAAKDAPHNKDSYLLISPGPDGRYGTSDDITNFEHNGQ
jgi:type II secretory pathway pseudopilin PulG